jgi:hypothetical protein
MRGKAVRTAPGPGLGRGAASDLRCDDDAHAILHLGWDAVVADDRTGVAQPAGFALDDETPQRVARLLDQCRPGLTAFGVVPSRAASPLVVWSHTVVSGEGGQRRLERAAQTAERRCLFLRNLVIERDVPCAAGNRA